MDSLVVFYICTDVLIGLLEFNAYDNDAWILRLVEFTKQALQHPHVKVIGVCYGHQIVGRAFGATVMKHDQGTWETSVCDVQLTDRGRDLFGGKSVLVRKSAIRCTTAPNFSCAENYADA